MSGVPMRIFHRLFGGGFPFLVVPSSFFHRWTVFDIHTLVRERGLRRKSHFFQRSNMSRTTDVEKIPVVA